MAIASSLYGQAAAALRERLPFLPQLAIVLGSGLGGLADALTDSVRIPYGEIPGFPASTVASHAGELVAGRLNGRPVIMLRGRAHYYEGYEMDEVAFYVRVMKLLEVGGLLLTNAAGAVNESFCSGDLMVIEDHLFFHAVSPVRGEYDPVWGERFFDMTHAYDPALIALAEEQAAQMDLPLRRGVYFFMPGPQYETPAEIRAIRALGADAVGMSTVPEAITAAQCGLPVLAISCITNMAAGITRAEMSHEEVVSAGAAAGARLGELVRRVAAKWDL